MRFSRGQRNRSIHKLSRAIYTVYESLETRKLMSGVPTPDPTFNGTGQVLDDWAGGVYATVTGATTLPSGQIIAVGQGIPAGGTHQELFVARFNANGSADNTFNPTSKVNYRFYNPFTDGSDDYANGITLLANGNFIVSGSDGNTSSNLNAKGYIFEFTAAGALNTSFGNGGSYTDAVQSIEGIAVQGSNILIGGVDGTTDFAISRLTSAGKLDTTFGAGGRVIFSGSAVTTLAPSQFAPSGFLSVRADNSIVYSGVVGSDGDRSGLVANFTAQGKASAAFGSSSGEILINYGGDDAATATLRPDGGLLVTDTQFDGSEVHYDVANISSTGAKSTPVTIGSQQLFYASLGYAGAHQVLQQNGQLLVTAHTEPGDDGGEYNDEEGDSDFYRSNSTISGLDSSFGDDGDYSLISSTGADLFADDISLTPDGKVLIAGFAQNGGSTDSIMLARYNLSSGTGNVTGTVYNDKNLNGKDDSGEAEANVPVYADLTNAGKYVTGDPITTTDVFGNYSLSNLSPGKYTIRVDTSLLPAVGVLTPTAGAYVDTVTAGGTVSAQNFALAGPGAAVYNGSTLITSGDTTPSTTDGTDFGSVVVGASGPSQTFTIRNIGAKPLTVGTVSLPKGFTLVSAPSGTVAAGSSTSFKVMLSSTTAGSYSGNVSFTDNSVLGSSYTFAIKGAVTSAVVTTSIVVTPPANQSAVTGVARSIVLGSFAETNATGPYKVKVTWGDGTADTNFTAAGPGSIAAQSHTFAKPGADTVSITVTDSAGHVSNKATFSTIVTAPAVTSIVVTPPANQSATAGVSKPITLGSFVETNATGPYTVSIGWGDGSANTTFAAAGPGVIASQPHTFAKAATDTVSITVTDSAGHVSNKATFAVTVSNAVPSTGTITGYTLSDECGNGITSDGTALPGVTVSVYADSNNSSTFSTNDKLLKSVVTGTSGAYSFTGLPAGQYFVAETVPSGDVLTAPAIGRSYLLNLTDGQSVTNEDFDNFKKVTSSGVSNVSYHVGTKTVSNLRGSTADGETVSVTFTVTAPGGEKLSLVSYTAPDAKFVASDAAQQKVFQSVSAFYAAGTYTISVKLPTTGHYQVDFVQGCVISQFGPAGSNIFYTQEGRLISADNE